MDEIAVVDAGMDPEIDEKELLIEAAIGMDADDFAALDDAAQRVVMFVLVREMVGTVRALDFRVSEYETKARELASPEGIQSLMNQFLGSGMPSGLGLLGGLLR